MPHKMGHMYLCIISWLERRYVNITFSDDEIDCDVEEIRALLNETDTNDEGKPC